MADAIPDSDRPHADAPDLASDADAAAVAQVLAGETDAFGELVDRHQKKAVAVSYRLLNNINDAQEVVQDAFLKAFRALDTLQDGRLFGPWLLRIVSNYSLNKRRGRSLRQMAPLETPGEDGGNFDEAAPTMAPDAPQQGTELGDRIAAAMEQLPEKQRLALVMFSIEEMPQKEVAEVLGMSVEAVKWNVFQARKKLKELLSDKLS